MTLRLTKTKGALTVSESKGAPCRAPLFHDCPECGEGDMLFVEVENYGSDTDGNRGVPLTHFVCSNLECWHGEAVFGDYARRGGEGLDWDDL